MRTESQLGWLNLTHLPILPLPLIAKHRVVIIPGDQPEQGRAGYGVKDFENGSFKTRVENGTIKANKRNGDDLRNDVFMNG